MRWRSFRKGLLKVHLWLAIILSLPMVLIGISGSALLVQREILNHSHPSATAGLRKTIPELIAAAQKAAPAGAVAKRVDLPASDGASASVRFTPREEDKPERDIFIDPVSLNILGGEDVVERGPILAFLITIHAFLAMPPPIGLPFVGWNGVIMTFMGLSGLALWWPRRGQWRNAFFVRKGARGLALHLDLHRTVGFWGLLVLLAVSISGIYLTFPQKIGPFIKNHFPAADITTDPLPGYRRFAADVTPDQAITSAQSAVRDARPMAIELPGENPSYTVELEPLGVAPTDPRVIVVLDGKTGSVDYIDDPRNYAATDQVLNVQHNLHFGVGLGWIWMILVFLSGLMPLLFAITGLTVWWKRRRTREAAEGADGVGVLAPPAAE
jgi:uncharacterized iron-regulated membrane protein